ncbi:nucleolin [Pleuronectes platessa]|uniref:nucleolin n=1 Tax=Pleuronectes platessa TaxID=8262 RepID=UPI00232A5E1A|nr:nucleolin [Pleuronectes platessa]
MSTVMSQPRPKEDEEEEEEEQGEEFVFDDSTDEEKPEEDSKGIRLDCVSSVQVSKKKEDSGTSGNVSQTITDGTKLPETSPPAGQEGISTEVKASLSPADAPVSESPSRAAAAAAAAEQPSTRAPCVGPALPVLPVPPSAAVKPADSAERGGGGRGGKLRLQGRLRRGDKNSILQTHSHLRAH